MDRVWKEGKRQPMPLCRGPTGGTFAADGESQKNCERPADRDRLNDG
jgi:hypothetical protein